MSEAEHEKLLMGGNDIAKSTETWAAQEGIPVEEEAEHRARTRTNSITSSMNEAEKKESLKNAINKYDTPIKITWKNINYKAKIATTKAERRLRPEKTKELEILRNCTGYALPG